MKLKTIDLCAGIGGIRRGFELAGGYRNIASAEIDEMACKTYEHLFHEDPRNDVTNEKFKKHLQTLHYDVLMAGFPCQAFSSVGLQHGFEDKTKGTIFFDIAKIIKMTRPKVVFLENVQNLLSHDKQATFKTIVDTLDRQLDYHIVGVTHDKDGIPQYKRSAFLRNSRDFGVPQNRPRVYIVAFSRAYFGQHISLLPEEAPTKRSRTPVFKSLADVLDKKVDSRFFLSSGYLDTFVNSVGDTPLMTPGKYIVLESDKNGRKYLPESRWTKIVPYFGSSKSMDGRGLRRESKKRYDFFRSVLGMEDAEIPRTVDTSTVIVMSREEANELVGSISFRFDDTDIKLTDLVPVSYYTESNREYQYGVNLSKNEPVIKITGKVSVARKLLLKKGGNRHIGLVVCGEDLYHHSESELPELLDRKSIQYVYLCMHLDSEASSNLIANYEEANLFACTKDFLLSNSRPPIVCNPYTEQMNAQIGAIIDKEVTATVIPGFINWETYRAFKRAMYSVKSSEYNSEQKDDFIVQSYSLMNLFMTAVFSIGLLEELIEYGIVDSVEKPDQRLHRIEETAKGFPDFLKESATSVVSILEDAYLELHDST